MRILIAVLALACATPLAARAAAVIPIPAEVEPGRGGFALGKGTRVVVPPGDAAALGAARRLLELFRRSHGYTLALSQGPARGGAIVFTRAAGGAPESYTLAVTAAGVTISAADAAGLYYGAVTLWQLAPLGAPTVAAVTIRDRPAFRWRGLMLDSARHYQRPEFIREFLDWMAVHKLNVLQWHLTDDQGWRLEIRRYPRLTEVGAWRVPAGAAAQADLDPATGAARRYGGYYSQATVRSLVAYAAERHITIVPEIDVPGHAAAALAAYPELGVAPVRLAAVPADWGIYPYVFNVSEPTCEFLERVLEEVLELFPGPYLHLGGDEVVPDEWLASSAAQARARELGLEGPKALHRYLVQRLALFLEARGRRLVGWDEILEPGLAPGAVVMSWRGADGAIRAAQQGHDVVLSPWPTLYLDFVQSTAPDEGPGRTRPSTLEDVYRFDPLPGTLAGDRARVLGLQANLWTEHVRTEARVEHMAFPRAAALAEVGWSGTPGRDWPDFLARLAVLTPHLRRLGLESADSEFAPRPSVSYDLAAGRVTLGLASSAHLGTIRYTLDGSAPSAASDEYTGPLSLSLPAVVAAASFAGAEPLSAPRSFRYSRALAGHKSSHELARCGEDVALALEDDDPLDGPRAVFAVDLVHPCWIWRQARLDGVGAIAAAVGQVPFNFQLGADRAKIRLPAPATPGGEWIVREDSCDGAVLAQVPLPPASTRPLTVLEAPLKASGVHDLCLEFAAPGLDPLHLIDWVELRDASR